MIRKIFFIYGFFSLFPIKLYAVYWNDTEFLNVVGRGPRRIRNKFVTFDTTDTDIELAFQFNVPFVAVPTDRSINNIKNSITSFANLNLGSVALASVMIIFGSITSFLWSLLVPKITNVAPNTDDTNTTYTSDGDATNIDDNNNPTGDDNDNPTGDDNNKPIGDDNSTTTTNDGLRSKKANDNTFMKLMYLIEETVEATVNPSVCIQQYMCTLSKSTAQNVAGGSGTSTDKILDGILSSRWILDMITGTAIHDAIHFGETTGDCYRKYYKCGFGSAILQELFSNFKQN